MTIASTGQTSIYVNGSNTPDAFSIRDLNTQDVNFKVKTGGQVYAREVIVKAAGTVFPDYVFAKGYKLMPLTEVRKFTETNNRLPNMPSAKEVEKNGANLGEIQRVSVEKIEELYKYIFEMEEKMKAMEKEIKELKSSK